MDILIAQIVSVESSDVVVVGSSVPKWKIENVENKEIRTILAQRGSFNDLLCGIQNSFNHPPSVRLSYLTDDFEVAIVENDDDLAEAFWIFSERSGCPFPIPKIGPMTQEEKESVKLKREQEIKTRKMEALHKKDQDSVQKIQDLDEKIRVFEQRKRQLEEERQKVLTMIETELDEGEEQQPLMGTRVVPAQVPVPQVPVPQVPVPQVPVPQISASQISGPKILAPQIPAQVFSKVEPPQVEEVPPLVVTPKEKEEEEEEASVQTSPQTSLLVPTNPQLIRLRNQEEKARKRLVNLESKQKKSQQMMKAEVVLKDRLETLALKIAEEIEKENRKGEEEEGGEGSFAKETQPKKKREKSVSCLIALLQRRKQEIERRVEGLDDDRDFKIVQNLRKQLVKIDQQLQKLEDQKN